MLMNNYTELYFISLYCTYRGGNGGGLHWAELYTEKVNYEYYISQS